VRARIRMFKGFATGGFDRPMSGGCSTINDDAVHSRAAVLRKARARGIEG